MIEASVTITAEGFKAALGTGAVMVIFALIAGGVLWLVTGPFRFHAGISGTSPVANGIATIAWPLIVIAAGLGAWGGFVLMT